MEVAATVDGEPIDLCEVDARLGIQLLRVRNEEYLLRRRALEQLAEERLLAKEADRRKSTVGELIRAEQDRAGAAASAVEVRAALVSRLREAKDVSIKLKPPRVTMEIPAGMPTRGAATAQVTILEFSDCECPYCRKLKPVLALLEEEYAGKVKRVFAHYPLEKIHRRAVGAARVSECARQVGRFWQAYEWLFENPHQLDSINTETLLGPLGLDAPAAEELSACVADPRSLSAVRRDLALGTRLGVSGTPAVFINGRLVSGAQRSEVYRRIIEEELSLSGGSRVEATDKRN